MSAPDTNTDARLPAAPWVDRSNTKLAVLAAATILTLYLCYLLVRPFMPALVWSVTLAVVTHRFWQWLARHVPQPSLRAGIAVGAVAIALLAPVTFLVYFSAAEITETVKQWQSPDYQPPWQDRLAENPRLAEAWNWVSENFDLPAMAQETAQAIQAGAATFFSGLAYTAVQAFLTLFVLFFLYRDERSVLQAVRRLSPMSDQETDQVLDRLRNTILATIYGSLVVALVQGALGGVIFFLLGLPGPVLWAAAMGLLALVPYLGTFVVWAPAAIVLALHGEWVKAGVLVGWGLCVIAMIDNLLYPVLVGNRLHQHSVISFIAIIGGVGLFGATGIVLGPVIVALTFALLDIWRQRTSDIWRQRTSDAAAVEAG